MKEALDAAIARAEALAEKAKEAKASFDDLADSIQDALDQETGDNEAIEDRRHKKALQDLYDQAKAAGQLNSLEYQQAVANENKLHALKLKDIKEQQDAANPKAKATPTGGGIYEGLPGQKPGVPINVHFNGRTIHLNVADDNHADEFEDMLRKLARAKGNSI